MLWEWIMGITTSIFLSSTLWSWVFIFCLFFLFYTNNLVSWVHNLYETNVEPLTSLQSHLERFLVIRVSTSQIFHPAQEEESIMGCCTLLAICWCWTTFYQPSSFSQPILGWWMGEMEDIFTNHTFGLSSRSPGINHHKGWDKVPGFQMTCHQQSLVSMVIHFLLLFRPCSSTDLESHAWPRRGWDEEQEEPELVNN